jgi:hypothetical protein
MEEILYEAKRFKTKQRKTTENRFSIFNDSRTGRFYCSKVGAN